jgi:hypothetical protein
MGVPKAVVNAWRCAPAMMDEVAGCLDSALLKVVSNKGAPGPDGVTMQALRERWPTVVPVLRRDLLEGRWRPGEVRRVLIPKAGGGQRGQRAFPFPLHYYRKASPAGRSAYEDDAAPAMAPLSFDRRSTPRRSPGPVTSSSRPGAEKARERRGAQQQ